MAVEGWYPDPYSEDRLAVRWWDGTTWTDDVARQRAEPEPAPERTPPPPPPPPPEPVVATPEPTRPRRRWPMMIGAAASAAFIAYVIVLAVAAGGPDEVRTSSGRSTTTTVERATTTATTAAPTTTEPATTTTAAPDTSVAPATTTAPVGPFLPRNRADLFQKLCDLAAGADRGGYGADAPNVRSEADQLLHHSDSSDRAASAPIATNYPDLGSNADTTHRFVVQECVPLGLA